MKSLREDCYNPFFSHIYVEKAVWEHPRARAVLARFPSAVIVEIGHYKDVFCRRGQDYKVQHRAQKLILAARPGKFFYEGAPVCQSFGNLHFYNTSLVMNCIYDCEYCYLKGMYPSANLVVFVDLEAVFAEAEHLLKRDPLYLCISYDTDLLALEAVLGYVRAWSDFARDRAGLTLEVRTKCADRGYFERAQPLPNVIYAFTISPQAVIEACEHQTPSLSARLACAAFAIRCGFAVRLCFDPMIYLPGWRQHYKAMMREVRAALDLRNVVDVSVGTFRISQEYLKKMRRQEPDSVVVQFPYQNDHGYYHYPDGLLEEMEVFLTEALGDKLPEEKIFRWNRE